MRTWCLTSEYGHLRYIHDKIPYPLHRPLSSNVPIRIFRIQGSCCASTPTPTSTSAPACSGGAFFGCARCASKRPLIESTVVLNPRLPKKSVGAGGCFCAESIFRANGTESPPHHRTFQCFGGGPQSHRLGRKEGVMVQNGLRSQVHAPSLMRRRRPSRGDSVITIAAFLASNVAKSTYAKLRG